MSQTLDSGGMTVDIVPIQNQSTTLERTEAPGTSGHIQGRLQKFLKENLKALGVAQIMIGVKCIFYGIIGFFAFHSEKYRIIFFSFCLFFPLWGALSFIISGSLNVVSAKKQTKSLLRGNLGANTLSTFVSIAGICILSYNLIKIFHYDCKGETPCYGIKTVVTGLVTILMILSCLQIFISLPLSMLIYNVDDENIGWISVLPCWKSASEDPYQDLLPQASIYEDLQQKGPTSNYTVTVNKCEASPL